MDSEGKKASDYSNDKNPIIAVENYPIYWARIGGWPAWPARICSKPEKRDISVHKPKTELPFIPMTFLGLKCQRGWVPASSLTKFDSVSFSSRFQLVAHHANEAYLGNGLQPGHYKLFGISDFFLTAVAFCFGSSAEIVSTLKFFFSFMSL